MTLPAIGIIGGTGNLGLALAKRFAAAGHRTILGSRQPDRATEAVAALTETTPSGLVSGAANAEAAEQADIIVLAVPFTGMDDILTAIQPAAAEKVVVSAIVPFEFVDRTPRIVPIAEGSVAQRTQAQLPESQVVAAFHHVSAVSLSKLDTPIDSDVLVCGDSADAKEAVLALVHELSGARGIDAGPLASALAIEALTGTLLHINGRYRVRASIRITNLPDNLGHDGGTGN